MSECEMQNNEVFLYLNRPEWAETWINGGEVPISLASKYRDKERRGIMTPDENLIYKSEIPFESLSPFVDLGGAEIKGFSFVGNKVLGGPLNAPLVINLPDIVDGARYHEDIAILSFSRVLSEDVLKRLGKSCCVAIENVSKLKQVIDEQLGLIGEARDCHYTRSHERNHFLKSVEDAWQKEYRMAWLLAKECKVTIPKNTARRVL